MGLAKSIIMLMAKLPTYVWIIIGLLIVVPTIGYAIRRGIKILLIVGCVLAILFIFPSIGSSFMQRAGLTWDDERKTLINRNGTEIDLSDVLQAGQAVALDAANKKADSMADVIKKAKDMVDSGEAGETASQIKDTLNQTTDGSKVIDITTDIVENALRNGISLDNSSAIIEVDGKYFLVIGDEPIPLTSDWVDALGISGK